MKAAETGHGPSFLWFTRAGQAYLVTDADALARVGRAHASAPEAAGDQPGLGQRLRELADELLRSGVAEPLGSPNRR